MHINFILQKIFLVLIHLSNKEKINSTDNFEVQGLNEISPQIYSNFPILPKKNIHPIEDTMANPMNHLEKNAISHPIYSTSPNGGSRSAKGTHYYPTDLV